jgi:phosphoribosyl-ATP pyrophosphohydrolase
MSDILARLGRVLAERRNADPGSSYVASLYAAGLPAMREKIREEAGELAEADPNDRQALVHEAADLWFHTLVLLAFNGLGPAEVLAELERRSGRSGLDEKAGRLRE